MFSDQPFAIAVHADDRQKAEILAKGIAEEVAVHWVSSTEAFSGHPSDAYFDLMFTGDETCLSRIQAVLPQPVFVHSVVKTTEEIGLPVFRMNAWPGFLTHPTLELASRQDAPWQSVERVFSNLGWKYIAVPDLPGFISARVLSMIINEALFALQEGVSSEEEIDLAMRLGTGYPQGPLEWGRHIGFKKIYELLKKISESDKTYDPSPLLGEWGG